MDSLAMSQQEPDLWLPHPWPLRRQTAFLCFWPSSPELWRHQRSVSQPCFHRVKWKVHNPLLIALPRAVEQPQLNTGPSWLPANLSNKLTSSLFPQRMLSDFSPPMSYSLWHQLLGTQNYSVYIGKCQEVDLSNTCEPLSFVFTWGNIEDLGFYFPCPLSHKSVYIYNFPTGLQK